ncbi:hypothetical protein CSW64_10480 [Caulobacter mirabilis]|uniref:DUF192 domain-containing protein n=2 Tax=Caulobacter mirabilis TaxID=69666 RepID=A0A2D2AXU8_9CAUL|nr:hypothetical protein CSW64_10480 [Caulobacter mirabilis]
MRDAGRRVVPAAMVFTLLAGVSACGDKAPAAAAIDAAKPVADKPDAVLEPLSIETAKGPVVFRVEIADDDAERERGLMYRTALAPDRGMLFVFDETAPRAFWMKNTYIPLDILYIGGDGRIVSIAARAEPFNETPIPSRSPARGVLEIYGGRAAELGIQVGDRVRHRVFQK